jgi:hypothetical protein
MFRLRVVAIIKEPHLTILSGDYVVKASVSWLELSWLYTLYQLQRLFLVESYDRTIAFGEVEGPGDGWETNGPGLLLLSPVTTDENLSRQLISPKIFEPGTSQNFTTRVILLGFSFGAFRAQISEGRSVTLTDFLGFP